MTNEHKTEHQAKKVSSPAKRKSEKTAFKREMTVKGGEHFVVLASNYRLKVKESERPLALVGVSGDPYKQAQAAATGLKTFILKKLESKGWMSRHEVRLIVDPRTLSHRIAKNQPLSIDEADKAIRVARLLEKGLGVFGTQEKVMNWWRRPSARFGNSSPLELAKTEHGGRLVEEALVQIDEGMFA